MLKSFKSYIKESQDQEMEVLRDLLKNGLITKEEFWEQIREANLWEEVSFRDYDYRYHMSLHVFNAKVNTEDIEALVEKKIDELPETEVVSVKRYLSSNYHSSSRRYIVDVVSNYEEREFVDELYRHISETPGFEANIHWVELH